MYQQGLSDYTTMTVKLKPITETSWLVLGDTEEVRIGLLTEIRDRYVLMIKGEKQQFTDRKEVNKFFSQDVFSNTVQEDTSSTPDKMYFINGFPVDFDSPNEVVLKGNPLPLFSKKASSDVYYCAGHYCINFPKNWMPGYCPKLSTLEAYGYEGPFKTDIEMRAALTRLRKNKK